MTESGYFQASSRDLPVTARRDRVGYRWGGGARRNRNLVP